MLRLSYHVLISLAVAGAVLADHSCSDKYPIYVDVHNRVVGGGGTEFQYGSFIGTAVPSQNQSIWPSLRRNETTFTARGFCDTSRLANCINRTGGTVDFNLSSTWREDLNYRTRDSSSLANTSVFGTDTMHLWVHYFDPSPAASVVDVPNTPVEYALSGDVSPNVVGLGSSSTLMQSLFDQNHITAKTYGLMVGDGMIRAGPRRFNGSHTFGGYDAARMTGNIHTYPMDLAQPDFLPVTVADIILDDPSNSQIRNRSILDNGTPFEARITTDRYPMLLPASVTRNIASLLGGSSSTDPDGSLQTSGQFQGVMRIRLSDGFEITLPRETITNPDGLLAVQENTDDNYAGPFYLSTAWLSQVYLTLDYDARQFHLAQAIMNATYIIPIALCEGDIPQPHNYGPKNSSFVRNGMIGAVLGGVIGGLAATFAGIYTFLWWRRHAAIKAQQKRWTTEATFKDRGSEEMEMERLSPQNHIPPFPWSKGKAPVAPRPHGETAYQGLNYSDDRIGTSAG